MSEGVRFMFGAIRSICTNGMVFGKILSKYYRKHTKGFKIGNLKDALSATYDQIPAIQAFCCPMNLDRCRLIDEIQIS